MEATLKEINAIVGVVGSFVCTTEGAIVARAMPTNFDVAQLDIAARVTVQTFQALETTGQRINDVDLTFEKGRLLLKNLPRGVLSIVCVRNINIPLLNLAASAAVKKLATEFEQAKTQTAPAKPASQTAVSAETQLSSVVTELEQEARRFVEEGKHYRLRLRVLNDVAIALACPQHRNVLVPLTRKHLELGGFASEIESIEILFEQLGFASDRKFNAFYNNKRLRLTDAKRDLTVDVFLDSFSIFHHLDIIPFLTQEEFLFPITALFLARLQLVEITESGLRDLCALLLDHDLGIGAEKGKIDAAYITRLCADDWGWYKTISMNLDRMTSFAGANLSVADRTLVAERTQRLRQSMDSTPKSLRWQTRARLGESVKWYEIPMVYKPASARPDMALG